MIVCSKWLNFINFQFLSLKIGQNNLVQKASLGQKLASSSVIKNIVQRPLKFGADPFQYYNPLFTTLRAAHPTTKRKVELSPSPTSDGFSCMPIPADTVNRGYPIFTEEELLLRDAPLYFQGEGGRKFLEKKSPSP